MLLGIAAGSVTCLQRSFEVAKSQPWEQPALDKPD